jgi:hypothetical protein
MNEEHRSQTDRSLPRRRSNEPVGTDTPGSLSPGFVLRGYESLPVSFDAVAPG